MTRRRAVLAVVAALAVPGAAGAGLPPEAGARPATAAEVRELAGRAAGGDEGALAGLRDVDAVDGRPADLDRALAGAEGDELTARLRELAGGTPSAGDPADPRGQARDVLEGRRFRDPDVPRPFEGVLEAIGDALRPVVDAIASAFGALPGGTGWVAAAGLVLLVAALLARRVVQRRSVAVGAAAARADEPAGAEDGAAALEHAAARAEAEGRWEDAVRLRFRAGLARLDERGALELRPSLTTGEARRALRLPAFDRLGLAFDRVVYGRAPAGPPEAAEQREGWPEVLASAPAVRTGEEGG